MRYEKQFPDICKDSDRPEALLCEYEDILYKLEKELYKEGKSILYRDLIELIVMISDYMIASENARERIGVTMGGKVLELASEREIRLRNEAVAAAVQQTTEQVTEQITLQGLQALVSTLKTLQYPLEEICAHVRSNPMYADVTREEIEKLL